MTEGRLVPNIATMVPVQTVHVEAFDANWNLIPDTSFDYLTTEDAKEYIAREFISLKRLEAELAPFARPFVMPVFTIDGEQYAPTPYTTSPIGGWYVMRAAGLRCTYRILFDGSCEVNVRQPLPEGTTFPTAQALADALAVSA